MKQIRYAAEAIVLYIFFAFFRILPVASASNVGGFIGRTIGPKLAASRKAYRNLNAALPQLESEEQKEIITEMWDNLGRVIAEYPHLESISTQRAVLENSAILQDLIMQEQPAVFFGAHQGNWEVNGALLCTQFNQPVDITYRAPNNPWSGKLLMKARTLGGQLGVIAKSRSAGKMLIQSIKNKRHIGVLLDQKYREGLAVPFFGMPAMTNPVFIQLCQKYDCPLIPVRNIRLGPARFEIRLYEPIELFTKDGQARSAEDVLIEINALLEDWIIQNPGQWLWLHRRWDSLENSNSN